MRKTISATLVSLAVVGFAGTAGAANPTQADFDDCNRQAAAKVGSPSASPGTGPLLTTPERTPREAGGTPASPATPKTGPMITSPEVPGQPGQGRTGAEATAHDSQLHGMAPAGQGDPNYQAAYRDCMRARGH